MNFIQNKSSKILSKVVKSFLIGTSLLTLSTFTERVKANTPPVCKDVLGTYNSETKVHSFTATQIANANIDFCTQTPERFQMKIFELGLCAGLPIGVSDDPKTFNKTNCVATMISANGVDADIRNTTVALPSAPSRPPSNTYTHAYIIIENTFGLRGSIKINDGNGGVHQYCSKGEPDPGDATAAAASCVASNHEEELDNFDDDPDFDPYFPPHTMNGGGQVSALLTTDDTSSAAGNKDVVTRLIGVFDTNSGTAVVITDKTSGLEMQLSVEDVGYGLGFSNAGVPNDFGSMPFKPIFNTF